jgi:tetratricopeptide (TPR) repeat protein
LDSRDKSPGDFFAGNDRFFRSSVSGCRCKNVMAIAGASTAGSGLNPAPRHGTHPSPKPHKDKIDSVSIEAAPRPICACLTAPRPGECLHETGAESERGDAMKTRASDKAAALQEEARRHSEDGQLQRAATLQMEAAEVWRKAGDIRREADCRQAAGALQCRLDDFNAALASFEQALLLRSRVNDERGEAAVLEQQGEAFRQSGRPGKAVSALRRALDLYIRIGNREAMGRVLHLLGLACSEGGTMQQALRFHAQALDIRREIGDFEGFGNSLHDLGALCLEEGMVRKAHRLLEDAAVVRRAIGDKAGLGRTMRELGKLCEGTGDVQQALHCYEAARQLAADPEVASIADEVAALKSMASAAMIEGDGARALAPLDEATRLAAAARMTSELGVLLYLHGVSHMIAGQMQEALASLYSAKIIQEHLDERSPLASTLTAIGVVEFQKGAHEAAQATLTRAVALREGTDEHGARANTLAWLARACEAQGRKEEAQHHAQAAAFLVEHAREESHDDEKSEMPAAISAKGAYAALSEDGVLDVAQGRQGGSEERAIVRYLH